MSALKGWPSHGEWHGSWKRFDFTCADITLTCHLRFPRDGAAAGAALPLLLFLHSASYAPVGDLFPEGDAWVDDEEPMFILCPRCPDEFYWLLRGDSWKDEGGCWEVDARGYCYWSAPGADEMAHALVALLREVARRLPADPRRLFLSGCSQGGHGCLDLASRRPGLFAAVAPVAAHLDAERLERAATALRGVPLWAFHGRGDQCCPFEDMERLVERLGHTACLTAYGPQGTGCSVHNSASDVAYVSYGRSLFAWMMRQAPRTSADLD